MSQPGEEGEALGFEWDDYPFGGAFEATLHEPDCPPNTETKGAPFPNAESWWNEIGYD